MACHATDGPPTNGPAGPSMAAMDGPAGPSYGNHRWSPLATDGPPPVNYFIMYFSRELPWCSYSS